jgi:tRNA dimethylallyltransferase
VNRRPRILVILGPTATGKTALAVEVARRVDGEIISADSRQAYRSLEVGTAAPSPADRNFVPHHGVAFLDPGERYGAGRFARLCRGWVAEIESRGRTPILAGGTGFFVRAVTRPVFAEPDLDGERRAALESYIGGLRLAEVRRWVRRLDPDLASSLPVIDRQRGGRTVELALLTGRSLSWWQRNAPAETEPIPARTWVLGLAPAELRRRIEERTARLLESGWVEEVDALRSRGYGRDSPALTSIGYRDVWRLAAGEISREEAVKAIVRDTWQYARRQRTWLRHQLDEDAIRLDAETDTGTLADRIAAEWSRSRRAHGARGEAERDE